MSWFSFQLNDFAVAFLGVLLEGIPFLLLGSLISGVVDVFVSASFMARIMPRSSTGAIFLSGLLGLIFPMCECGSVVVIRRFIRKGLPLSTAVTYMLAAPVVSPIVAFSTYTAFKGNDPWKMTSLRLALGYLIAIGVGFIVRKMSATSLLQPAIGAGAAPAKKRAAFSIAAAPGAPDFAEIAAAASVPKKLLLAVQSATSDFLDVAFFFVIGAALASTFNTAVNQQIIQPLATHPPLAIGSMMVLAAILAVCSTTDAFIAANFKIFPFAAKLAFLLYGPVFDLKLFWLYGVLFKRRFVALLGLGLFVAIGLICWRIDSLNLDRDPIPPLAPARTPAIVTP